MTLRAAPNNFKVFGTFRAAPHLHVLRCVLAAAYCGSEVGDFEFTRRYQHFASKSKTGIPEGVGFGRRPFIYAIPILRLAPASRFFMALSPISPSTDFDFEVATWLVGGLVLQGRRITRIAFIAICSGSVLWSGSSCSPY